MVRGNVKMIRSEFPALREKIKGRPLAYLDNAATTQTPRVVLEAMRSYKERYNANPHRGIHYLGVQATERLEAAREKVRKFLNAASPKEVIFTKNATEALNLIAYSYGLSQIKKGEEIVLCISEHHSNLVPWQRVARLKGALVRYLYLTADYSLDWEQIAAVITEKTALVGIAQMSNVLGTIYPLKELAAYAHRQGAVVVVDGAQSVPHLPVDVQDLDADFFVFSGHKVFGPMGIGVLYGKEEFLSLMPPFLMGGEMVEYVGEQDTTFNELPSKFEAGTLNVEGAVGLGAALDFLQEVGWDAIQKHEFELTEYALEKLAEIPQLTLYGPPSPLKRGPVISFALKGCHPHDVATIADSYGVALRAGHHCAQPLLAHLGVSATSRASFALYNTLEEIDQLVAGIKSVRGWLGYES